MGNANLVPKVITDVNGIQRTVHVKPNDNRGMHSKSRYIAVHGKSSATSDPSSSEILPVLMEEESSIVHESLSSNSRISQLDYTEQDSHSSAKSMRYSFVYTDDFGDEHNLAIKIVGEENLALDREKWSGVGLIAQATVRVDSFADAEEYDIATVDSVDEALDVFSKYAFDDQAQIDAEDSCAMQVNRQRKRSMFSEEGSGTEIPLMRLDDSKILGARIKKTDADLGHMEDDDSPPYFGRIFVRDANTGKEAAFASSDRGSVTTEGDFIPSDESRKLMHEARERFAERCSLDNFYNNHFSERDAAKILDIAYDISAEMREQFSD